MKKLCSAKILANEQLANQYWRMVFDCGAIAESAKPGQFIEVYFSNSTKLFPRPFSIAKVSDEKVELIYKVIGSQTEQMAGWATGKSVEILGPLGNSFSLDNSFKTHLLVGGGVGLAPMVFLSHEMEKKGMNFRFFSGGRDDQEYFPLLKDAKRLYISTGDGSLGFHGNVVENLSKEIRNFPKPAVIYACGPEKMSAAVKKFGEKHGISVQISMETLMACGMGLCQGCAIKTYDSAGNDKISLVCKDGPVFKGEELNFD